VTRVRVQTSQPVEAIRVLGEVGLTSPVAVDGHAGNVVPVVADLGDVDSSAVTAALVRAGVPVHELVVERPDLEELFVGLTGEGFDVDE
jgi:ABC-2 type transport system ATP-binding protein